MHHRCGLLILIQRCTQQKENIIPRLLNLREILCHLDSFKRDLIRRWLHQISQNKIYPVDLSYAQPARKEILIMLSQRRMIRSPNIGVGSINMENFEPQVHGITLWRTNKKKMLMLCVPYSKFTPH